MGADDDLRPDTDIAMRIPEPFANPGNNLVAAIVATHCNDPQITPLEHSQFCIHLLQGEWIKQAVSGGQVPLHIQGPQFYPPFGYREVHSTDNTVKWFGVGSVVTFHQPRYRLVATADNQDTAQSLDVDDQGMLLSLISKIII